MPTYFIHGFRWPRPLIRIHIILQNLDDAAAEWLVAPQTTRTMLENFTTLYPDLMPSLQTLQFIEQYDPYDTEQKSQPYAYVADFVQEIKLGVDVDEMRAKGISNDTWSAMVELRDKLAPGEKLSWFVVVCGDTERWAPPIEGQEESEGSQEGTTPQIASPSAGGQQGFTYMHSPTQRNRDAYFSRRDQNDAYGPGGGGGPPAQVSGVGNPPMSGSVDSTASESRFSNDQARPSSKGFKSMFGLRKSKSTKSLKEKAESDRGSGSGPPLPPTPGYAR